eukprot:54033-Rhodomonas_salina.2
MGCCFVRSKEQHRLKPPTRMLPLIMQTTPHACKHHLLEGVPRVCCVHMLGQFYKHKHEAIQAESVVICLGHRLNIPPSATDRCVRGRTEAQEQWADGCLAALSEVFASKPSRSRMGVSPSWQPPSYACSTR